MNFQSKFASSVQFFLGSVFLFVGLVGFKSALTYTGRENNFLADNWGTPLVLLLIIVFSLGWWLESFMEYLALFRGRKLAMLAAFGFVLVVGSIGFGSLVFIPLGFLQYAMSASVYILMSGFFFRLSVARSEVITKLQAHN